MADRSASVLDCWAMGARDARVSSSSRRPRSPTLTHAADPCTAARAVRRSRRSDHYRRYKEPQAQHLARPSSSVATGPPPPHPDISSSPCSDQIARRSHVHKRTDMYCPLPLIRLIISESPTRSPRCRSFRFGCSGSPRDRPAPRAAHGPRERRSGLPSDRAGTEPGRRRARAIFEPSPDGHDRCQPLQGKTNRSAREEGTADTFICAEDRKLDTCDLTHTRMCRQIRATYGSG
jgi:hypothetical protein